MNQPDKKLELRSEKVRSIIGQIPSFLTRNGIGLIALGLVSTILVSYLVPVRDGAVVNIELQSVSELIESPSGGIFRSVNSLDGKDNKAGKVIGIVISDDNKIKYKLSVTSVGTPLINFQDGDHVKKGDIVAKIVPTTPDSVYCNLLIPARFNRKIQEGKIVKVQLSGEPSVSLTATISRIFPIPLTDTNNNKQTKMRLDFSERSIGENLEFVRTNLGVINSGTIILSDSRLIDKIGLSNFL